MTKQKGGSTKATFLISKKNDRPLTYKKNNQRIKTNTSPTYKRDRFIEVCIGMC